MAITYVGGTTGVVAGSTGTTTNISLTALTGGSDTSPSAGDLVVICYSVSSTVQQTLSATGYTSLATGYANDTYDANLYFAYKVMGSTPDTNVTVSATGATTDGGVVAVQVFRRAFVSGAAVSSTGGNTIVANPPPVIPTIAGSWVVYCGAGGGNALTAGSVYTASYSTVFRSAVQTANTNDPVVGLGYIDTWTSGSYNPAAFTFGGTDSSNYSWASATVALAEQNAPVATNIDTGAVRLDQPAAGTLNLSVAPVAYGSVAFDGNTTGTNTVNFSSLTYPNLWTVQQNDVVFVFVSNSGTTTTVAPSVTTAGYTLLSEQTSTDTYSGYSRIYIKVMGATPDTSVAIGANTGSVNRGQSVSIQIVRGADTSNPVDVTAFTNGANTILADPPLATADVLAASYLVFGAGSGSATNIAGATFTNTSASNFSSAGSSALSTTSTSVTGAGWVGSGALTSINPTAFGFSGTDSTQYSYTAYTVALRSVNDVPITETVTRNAWVPAPTVGQNGPVIAFVGQRAALAAPGAGTNSATATIGLTNLVGGLDNRPSEGDVVLIQVAAVATSSTTISSLAVTATGYTQEVSIDSGTGTTRYEITLLSKVMTSTPDTSVDITVTPSTNATYTGMLVQTSVFRAVGTPIIDVSNTAGSGITNPPNPPSVTTTSPGDIGIAAGATTVSTTFSSTDAQSFVSGSRTSLTLGVGLYSQIPASGTVFNPAAFVGSGPEWQAYTAAVKSVIQANTSVSLTGVQGSGQVGTVDVASGVTNVYPTGVSASGASGSVTTTASAVVSVTGLSATGQVGTITASFPITVPVTGVASAASVGPLASVTGSARVSVTGAAASAAVGSVTVDTTTYVRVSGVEATAYVGAVSTYGSAVATTSGLASSADVGSVDAYASALVDVSGVATTADSGAVAVIIVTNVQLTGVQAYGYVSGVLVWGPVFPDQNPNYAAVAPVQVPVWVDISGGSNTYTDVVPNQAPGYSAVDPDQDPGWTTIAT